MINHTATAKAMSPEDFELLLRAYVQEQMHRVGPKNSYISLSVHTAYGNSDIGKCQWQIGGYNEVQTKGEILSEVASEHIRRCGFTSTLRLLEGKIEAEQPMKEGE